MLRIDNLIFDAWGRRFFDQASVTVPADAKVGLVGRNGVGKSTLFKLILGELHRRDGDIEPAQARPDRLGRPGASGDAGAACSTRCWRPTSSAMPCSIAAGDRRARGPRRDLSRG